MKPNITALGSLETINGYHKTFSNALELEEDHQFQVLRQISLNKQKIKDDKR